MGTGDRESNGGIRAFAEVRVSRRAALLAAAVVALGLCVVAALGVGARDVGADFRVGAVERQPITAPAAEQASDRLVVTFAEDATAAERRAAVRGELGAGAEIDGEIELGLDDTEVVDVSDVSAVSAENAAAALEANPAVASAEPDMYFTPNAAPDDPEFHRLWHLENTGQTVGQPGTPGADIHAVEAWDVATDSSAAPIAIIDTGIDVEHPDVADNVWTNPGETGDGKEDNGVDDDGNGFVDDWRGWDFHSGDNDPTDGDGHGTMMAGAAAAVGNNGVAGTGVAWQGRVMALKTARDLPGTPENPLLINLISAIQAIAYADQAGAKVVNLSFSSGGSSPALANAISSRPHMLFVTSAGNNSENNDDPYLQVFPCSHPFRNLVCATASDHTDRLAGIAGFGRKNVDLAVPGVGIFTPHPINTNYPTGYVTGTGTSHSAAIFSASAALVWSHFEPSPSTAVAFVRARLLNTVDVLEAFKTKTAWGGRLNLYRALTEPPRQAMQISLRLKPKRVKAGKTTRIVVNVGSAGDLPLGNIRVCGKASRNFVRSIGCRTRNQLGIGKTATPGLQVRVKKRARPGRVINVKVTVRANGIPKQTRTVKVRVR